MYILAKSSLINLSQSKIYNNLILSPHWQDDCGLEPAALLRYIYFAAAFVEVQMPLPFF